MEWILVGATLLGGIAALWFFWDKIRQWLPGRGSVIDELTKLRRAGRKRYTEWWTFCQNPEKSEIARKESEEIRLKVIDILKRKVSPAEADYFNIPKAVEPFPDTTVKLCPQAVLINEWGHRLERLGEIIQRLTAR